MFQESGRHQGRKGRTPLESALERSLAGFLAGQEGRDSPLVVGVSGGADSMALLDALWRWKERGNWAGGIVVAHLNHLLRGVESDGDAEFVRGVAERYGLPSALERCDVAGVAQARRANLEAVARECRYDFLHRVALASLETEPPPTEALVLTAHNFDDQAETVLMRLLRGSGASGLTGIHPQRRLSDAVRLIRPLLEVDRAAVLAHCHFYGLDFRVDQSNFSIDYLRNRVRHELLVTLRDYNKGISATLVRTATLLRDDEACLQDLAREHRQRAMVGEGLAVDALGKLPPALRRRVVRDWIAAHRGGLNRLTAAHVAAVEGLLGAGQSGRKAALPGGLVVQRIFETLQFLDVPTTPPSPRRLDPGEPVEFGDFWILLHPESIPPPRLSVGPVRWSVRIPGDLPANPWRVRGRAPGDWLRPTASCHRIKLKTLMIRHKIPVTKRHTWPVIVTGGDQLIWVPGLALNAEHTPPHHQTNHQQGGDQSGAIQPSFWLLVGEKVK